MGDYSRTVFAAGIVCYNMNNFTKCIVLDGKRGTETDRCSYVLECTGHGDLITHIPPNRALVPTGEFFDLCKALMLERTFDAVKHWLETHYVEGIVFWLDGEPICKIKRSDFGMKWNN